jgi:hypothetical protein
MLIQLYRSSRSFYKNVGVDQNLYIITLTRKLTRNEYNCLSIGVPTGGLNSLHEIIMLFMCGLGS